MPLEILSKLNCDTAFIAGFEVKWKHRHANIIDALDYLHKSGVTEQPACIIACNRTLAEVVAVQSGSQALGQHLNLYFQHFNFLTDADRNAIRSAIVAADPSEQSELSTTFAYLNLLRIDMRDFLKTRTLNAFAWEGIGVEDNPNFHMLLHNGLFGSDYEAELTYGLKSISTTNQIAEYLTEMAQAKPLGYDGILQSYLGDTRMTQPDFLNPETIGQIARQLLVAGQ